MMILLHVLFTVTGAFGASLGAELSGLTWASKRLHLLVAVDAIALILFCKLLKKDEALLGDYMAIPVVAVCAAAKVGCVIFRCCYGLVLYVNAQGVEVRFPSQIVELGLWITLILILFLMTKKGNVKGVLWPIMMIWFGFLRFAADFMRGFSIERNFKIMGMQAGQFWSLLVMLMGVAYLYYLLRKSRGRNPSVKEMIRQLLGMKA